ncbi:MAG: hypothetical protein FWD84_02040 [Oscillospiraceae bacterium]|nr:hypothetical protein [Oscillospiraceae bacterium]
MKKELELDVLGEFYTAILDKKYPGSFNITTYLKEAVDPKVLQKAVDDLVIRLPYLSGGLNGSNKWELTLKSPQVMPDLGIDDFSDYYKQGDRQHFRVLYGADFIKVEVTHVMTDGRSLATITKALLVRYFELLGLEMSAAKVISCASVASPEELEDPYKKFGEAVQSKSKDKVVKVKPYRNENIQLSQVRVVSQNFDLDQVKAKAKKIGATISEYLLIQIFLAMAEERQEKGQSNPIIANVPRDNRRFFPTSSIRNFIGNVNITMPEVDDMTDMAEEIHAQFSKASAETVKKELDEMVFAHSALKKLPMFLKKLLLKTMMSHQVKESTFTFTNLGRMELPAELTDRISHMAFVNGITRNQSYIFSCVSFENTLTLTATIIVPSDTAEKAIANMLVP